MKSYLRHLAKTMAIPALHETGVLGLARTIATRNRQFALNYHEIDAPTLAHHLDFLHKIVDFTDIDTFLMGLRTPRGRPLVVLTFDDGYRTFATEVAPLLTQRGIPAAWFVPTALVGTDDVFWFDRLRCAVMHTRLGQVEHAGRALAIRSWNRELVAAALSRCVKTAPPAEKARLLEDMFDRLGPPPESALAAFRMATPDQLKAIDHTVIAVGSHSHSHPQMSQLTNAELGIELHHSKRLLESWTGRPVHHFAFPSGDYDPRILRATEHAGYLSSWTTESRYRSNEDEKYRMPRLPVYGSSLGILSATIAFAHKGERRDA